MPVYILEKNPPFLEQEVPGPSFLPDAIFAVYFARTTRYADIVPGVLREMLDQVGYLEMDDDGIAVRGLLVRHLVLPNYLGNSRRCLRFLADLSPDTFVSIMSQYSPQYKACDYPEINGTLTKDEHDEITDYALDLGLENAFVQELESQEHYLPNFDQERPFLS